MQARRQTVAKEVRSMVAAVLEDMTETYAPEDLPKVFNRSTDFAALAERFVSDVESNARDEYTPFCWQVP